MIRIVLQSLPFFLFSYSAQILMKRGMSIVGIVTWSDIYSDPTSTISAILFNWFTIAAFASAGLGAITYMIMLSQYDLTYIFPILGALSLLLLPLIGRLTLNESVSSGRIIGTFLIALGMVIIARS